MRNYLGKDAGLVACLVVALVAGLTSGALADEQRENGLLSAMNERDVQRVMAQTDPDQAEVPGTTGMMGDDAGSTKMIPWLTVSVDYSLVTDYIWRGLNFSEYDTEGREDPNHQLGVTAELDLEELTGAPVGYFGANVWFEWFAGQPTLNRENYSTDSNSNLQEVDYTLYWGMDIPDTPFSVEFGWIAYHFPRARDSGAVDPDTGESTTDSAYTHEAYASLAYDDSATLGALLGIDGPVLSPTVTYYHDLDEVQAGILTVDISHEFAMADYGCGDVMVLKDLTVTPSAQLCIDHRYYDKAGVGGNDGVGTRLGYLLYQVDATLDLNGALDIPSQFGNFYVGGFLAYTNSFHDDDADVQDEFWGGMNFGWSW